MESIRVTGKELDMAYMRWRVSTSYRHSYGSNPFIPDRAAFMRFLNGDPLPLNMGQNQTGGDWDLSAKSGRMVQALNSDNWYTMLKSYLVE